MTPRPSKLGHEIAGVSEGLRANQINLARRELGVEDPWHLVGAAGEPGFQNNFENLPGYSPLAFRRDTEGKVHMRGQIRAVGGGAPSGVNIFSLPADYRPDQLLDAKQMFTGKVIGTGVPHWLWFITVEIMTTGEVRVPTSNEISFLAMDNIVFWTG